MAGTVDDDEGALHDITSPNDGGNQGPRPGHGPVHCGGDGDKCIGKGLVAGYHAFANSATRAAVKALLIERFGLPGLQPGEPDQSHD